MKAKYVVGADIRIRLSQFHDGQTVTPVVTAQQQKFGRVAVQLYWHDASDNTHLRACSTVAKSLRDAEVWIGKQGVRLG